MEEIIIDEEFNVDTKKVVENEYCRIVIDSASPHMELTKYTEVSGEEEVYKTAEVRYIDYWLLDLDSEEEYLSVFDELWNASYLLEEVQTEIDREVVINRKHWEIVLGRIVDKLAYVNDEGIEFFNPVWEHKYLPFYPHISTQDLIDQFEQFWELEPYTISAFAVPAGDYEIAGQVLENGLDLGSGYENLVKFGSFSSSPITRVKFSFVENTGNITRFKVEANADKNAQTIIGLRILTGSSDSQYGIYKGVSSLYISYKTNDKLVDNLVNIGGTTSVINKNIIGDRVVFKVTNITGGSGLELIAKEKIWEVNDILEIEDFIIVRDSDINDVPFVKNSRPDSKLTLPQLSSLGAITSKEMRGNHLVAQHENGTAIIKDAKINSNAPLSSLHWGLQAYKDENGNKRLFCSTADNTYPTGWENIKYDAEEGGNVVFYDVARNSTSNNIAGLITEEEGKLRVYIGEGYSNLCSSSTMSTWYEDGEATGNYLNLLIDKSTGTRFDNTAVNFISGLNLEVGAQYTVTFKSTLELINVTQQKPEEWVVNSFEKIGDLYKVTATKGSANYGYFDLKHAIFNGQFTLTNIQITKTSTPKPFTTGIVPNGALKVACDWTSENKSFVFKKVFGGMAGTETSFVLFSGGNYNIYQAYWDWNRASSYKNYWVSNVTTNVSGHANRKISSDIIYFGQDKYLGAKRVIQTLERILIYNNPNLTQAQMEAELAKDIYLPTYHHQSNSIINTYGITGMGAMYLYQPALTSAEIDAELEKDIYLPKTRFDIPNYKGE